MRVAFLSANGQAGNAIGKQLVEKLDFFLERGAEVRLFVESDERLHPRLAAHCQVVPRVAATGPVWDFLAGADLVLADYPHWYDLLHYLPLLAGNKPRIVVEYHGVTPPDGWQGSQRELLERGAVQSGIVWFADRALVHSAFTRAELVRATGYPRERITVIPCALAAPSAQTNPGRLRKKLGLEDKSVLLYVGRFAVNKRVPVLIEALSHLRHEQPEVHAVLLGDAADVYADEANRCLKQAEGLGVAARIHLLGQVNDDEDLADAYRSADVLVMPSVHEGFCLPVAEAMAAGLPVIATRAGALPETVGPAGLTFRADDSADLVRQIRRVLSGEHKSCEPAAGSHRKLAIVAFRFGSDIVGGAETSLRTIACTLTQAGHQVEVFTTCTRHESTWTNELPPGVFHEDGLVVRRFPIDAHDRARHHHDVRTILDADGQVSDDVEDSYLRNSIHSTALVKALAERIPSLDAVIVGPYLFGLTWDVARSFPEKTLLLPCFHDEPLARLKAWCHDCGQVGGILYHSPEEQDFAQSGLGLNHPRACQVGTFLATEASAPPATGRRYLVYCGRYAAQKNVPLLLEFMQRYQEQRPNRFAWSFLGTGELALPREPWLSDLGWLPESRKREILAGADALVQLSVNESLSLVALEAWAQGTPVLAHEDCAVLAGQITRSHGGRTIADYQTFAQALDDLWDNPVSWRDMGERGCAYVKENYGSRETFLRRLRDAVDGLRVPLRQHMRERGVEWSRRCRRESWREQFGALVEQVLDASPLAFDECLEIQFRHASGATGGLSASEAAGGNTGGQAASGTQRTYSGVTHSSGSHSLLGIRLINHGNRAAMPDGPGPTTLCHEVVDDSGSIATPRDETTLPGILLPGRAQPAALTLVAPFVPGRFQVRVWAKRNGREIPGSRTSIPLTVRPGESGASAPSFAFSSEVAGTLAEAHRRHRLPDDYVDVTEGFFARWKRWLKRKLLGNFKHAYIDVLSRQQSQVNLHLITAAQELAESCATLEHAVRNLGEKISKLEDAARIPTPRGESSSPAGKNPVP